MIDVFNKYAWVEPLKDKKDKTVAHGFVEVLNKSKHKPSRVWVDQGREFYNDISNLIKKSDLNLKLARLAPNRGLKAEQNKIVKLQKFDSRLI